MINTITPNGLSTKSKTLFQMAYGVGITINAKPEHIWSFLTNAEGFPRWNSTISSIKGKIALGEKIELQARIAPERIFKLKVSEFVPGQRMVWRDGSAPMFQGVRTFILKAKGDKATDFFMEERFSGLMLPLIAKALPDFGEAFEDYAKDLKREAERV